MNLELPRLKKVEDAQFVECMNKIMNRNGVLTIDGCEYQSKIHDLVDLGELGNGTSGHVVKMKLRQAESIIAVKVTTKTSFINL